VLFSKENSLHTTNLSQYRGVLLFKLCNLQKGKGYEIFENTWSFSQDKMDPKGEQEEKWNWIYSLWGI